MKNRNLWAVLIVTLSCNQQVYDEIYFAIMQNAIKSNITRQTLITRYNNVMTLRKLCNGQLSTWEQHNDTPINYKGEVK